MRKYYFSLRSNLLLLAFASLLFTFNSINAQVGIGTTDPQATLHIVAQGTQNVGLVVPSVTNNDHIAGTRGTIAYNSEDNGLMVVTDDNRTMLNLSSAANSVTAIQASANAIQNTLSGLNSTNISDIKIHENDLYFKDPSNSDFWLSASTLTYIFSAKGDLGDDEEYLGVGEDGVSSAAGYYIPFAFAIMEITAQDSEGENNREIRLFLQNNISSGSRGHQIFVNTNVDDRSEFWTTGFVRNNSAGRLLVELDKDDDHWEDPIIVVKIKKRISN
jgi:hypothetical protein